MKSRLANAASERLAAALADEPVMTEDEVVRVLSRIARTGRPGDRRRAAELLGKHIGMFRQQGPDSGPTLEDLILATQLPQVPKTLSSSCEPAGEIE